MLNAGFQSHVVNPLTIQVMHDQYLVLKTMVPWGFPILSPFQEPIDWRYLPYIYGLYFSYVRENAKKK